VGPAAHGRGEGPAFGFGLALRYDSFAGNDRPYVDAIFVTVYYDGSGCP